MLCPKTGRIVYVQNDCLHSNYLFTLEGISRNGHMKSPTKRLEQKFNQTIAFSKASSIANFVDLPPRQIRSLKKANSVTFLPVSTRRLVWYAVIKPHDCIFDEEGR